MLFHEERVYFSIRELAEIWNCRIRQVQVFLFGEDGLVSCEASAFETETIYRGKRRPSRRPRRPGHAKTRVEDGAATRIYAEKVWPTLFSGRDAPTPEEFSQIVILLEWKCLTQWKPRLEWDREENARAQAALRKKAGETVTCTGRVYEFAARIRLRQEEYASRIRIRPITPIRNTKAASIETRRNRLLQECNCSDCVRNNP